MFCVGLTSWLVVQVNVFKAEPRDARRRALCAASLLGGALFRPSVRPFVVSFLFFCSVDARLPRRPLPSPSVSTPPLPFGGGSGKSCGVRLQGLWGGGGGGAVGVIIPRWVPGFDCVCVCVCVREAG